MIPGMTAPSLVVKCHPKHHRIKRNFTHFDKTKQQFAKVQLEQESVIKEYLITAADNKNYRTKHYNLDMILAVGYRVRSPRGMQFQLFILYMLGL